MHLASEYLIQVNDKKYYPNVVLMFKVNDRDTKTAYIDNVTGTLPTTWNISEHQCFYF